MNATNETEIRQQLQAFLEDKHKNDDAVFIHELLIDGAQRRADLVMANGKLSAFEIKSELDNLDRLTGQLDSYTRLFEVVTVVAASKHIKKIENIIPSGVGLIEFDGYLFKKIRNSRLNNNLKALNWASHLTVKDLKIFLKNHDISNKGCRSELLERVEKVSIADIRFYTLQVLKTKFPELLEKRKLKKNHLPTNSVQAIDDFLESKTNMVKAINQNRTVNHPIQLAQARRKHRMLALFGELDES